MCILVLNVELAFVAPKNQDESKANTSKQMVACALEQNGKCGNSSFFCGKKHISDGKNLDVEGSMKIAPENARK